MRETISAVLLIVSLFAGTQLLKEIHDSVRKGAVEKAIHSILAQDQELAWHKARKSDNLYQQSSPAETVPLFLGSFMFLANLFNFERGETFFRKPADKFIFSWILVKLTRNTGAKAL